MTTVSVTIYRMWAKGRLWIDANDVVNALRAGGHDAAANALSGYIDVVREKDNR